jgi:anti-anti-sigma factor
LELAQTRYEDVNVIAAAGRVDHGNADAFKAGLEPLLKSCTADGDRLLLDLSGLEYISSAGLRVLMLAAREVKQHQGTLVLCSLQPVVQEIFEISRFNIVFKVYPDRRTALAQVSKRAAAAAAAAAS